MKKSTHRFIVLALTVVVATGLTIGTAAAQDMGNSGNVSLGTGVDFVSDYYFRGIVQETEGFVAQPFLEGSIAFADGAASVTAGTWSSLHSAPEAGDPEMWYETDFYAGVGFSFADAWAADATYTAYMSPNQSFGTVKELSLGLSYDDGLLGPYATFAFELDGQADGGNDEGTYLELGVEPSLPLDDSPVGVSFPVAIGLSLSNYYESAALVGDTVATNDNTFGFFNVGAMVSIPLSGIPAEYGSWEVTGGVNFLVFGDGLKVINGSDDDAKVIGVFGLSLGY